MSTVMKFISTSEYALLYVRLKATLGDTTCSYFFLEPGKWRRDIGDDLVVLASCENPLFSLQTGRKCPKQWWCCHTVVANVGLTGGSWRTDTTRFTFPNVHISDRHEPYIDSPKGIERHTCGRTIKMAFGFVRRNKPQIWAQATHRLICPLSSCLPNTKSRSH